MTPFPIANILRASAAREIHATDCPGELRLTATGEALDIQAAGDGDKPKTFSGVVYNGGPMNLEGFYRPVIVDLVGMKVAGKEFPVLQHHDPTRIVGHTTAIPVEPHRVGVQGVISGTGEAAKEVLGNARNRFPWQLSLGASVGKLVRIDEGEKVSVNGKSFTGPVLVARKTTLGEISFVPRGADSQTSATVAATQNRSTTMPIELTAEEKSRRDEIRELCAAGDHRDIEAKAVDEGWDRDRAELEILRAEKSDWDLQQLRGSRPDVHPTLSARGGPADRDTLEAAVLLHGGFDRIAEEQLGERAAEAGRSLQCRSLLDIFAAACRSAGHQPKNTHDLIRAAFSTASLSGVLGDSANKIVLDTYRAFPSVAKKIARKLSAKDFKTHTGYRLTGDSELEKVAATGELKYGSLDEDSFTYSVDTYGKMFGITRQNIINDNANVFYQVPQKIGRGAALRLERLFWTLVLANTGSFFSAANGNYITGAATALDSDALGTAVVTMMQQTDADGHPVNVTPKYLVVPPELKVTADKLWQSTNLVAGGGNTDDTVLAANVHGGKYEPLATPYLSNAAYVGNSALAWYLVGSPADVSPFGVAFLNGAEQPIVEEVDQPAEFLGKLWRGYTDIGVCQIDHRGAVKAKGEA